MSKFANKVLAGNHFTDDDWNNELLEAHRKSPSQTPRAFAAYKTSDGENSYERLARVLAGIVPKPETVVDLACGDGHLIPYVLEHLDDQARVVGIDMSRAELEIAQRNYASAQAQFLLEQAQQTSLPDQSVDVILCHMAFMLMMPLEPVVSEIARILKPGGVFCAVVGGAARGLYSSLVSELQNFYKEEFPAMNSSRVGDPRVRTPEGLKQLFNRSSGFSDEVKMDGFELIVDTVPDKIWYLFGDMYLIAMLPKAPRERLRRRLEAVARAAGDPSGNILLYFPMRQIFVRKL